jgi:hypothetical protein
MTVPTVHRIDRSYPAAQAGIAAALAALGNSADRVAETLRRKGFHGEPGESRGCPIAVYLRAVLYPTCPVSVGEARATVRCASARLDAYLPDPVRQFVARFDLGGYRFLYPADYVDPDTPDARNAPTDPLARSIPTPAGGVW